MNEDDLLELKKRIDKVKVKKSELTGQLNAKKEQLKDYKVSSEKQLKKLIDDETAKLESIHVNISNGLSKIEEKYSQFDLEDDEL